MPKPRRVYGPVGHKSFETALTNLFQTEFGFLGGPAVIRLIVDRIKALCDLYYPPATHFRFGQMLWFAVAEKENKGACKSMKNMKLVPVKLSIVTDEDLQKYRNGVSQREIRKSVMARLFKETKRYGGVLAEVDVAAIMHIDSKRVSKYFIEYQEETKEVLPTRSTIHDIGGSYTHKNMIVAEHFEGKQSPDIAKKYDHTVDAADRYIKNAEQVKIARDNGIPPEKIPFVTGMGKRLVNEYLALLEKIEKNSIKEDENIVSTPEKS